MESIRSSFKKSNLTLKIITLSLSVFILSMAIFSRLIVISVHNKEKSEVLKSDNPQVLSSEDQLYENQSTGDQKLKDNSKVLPAAFPGDIPIYPGLVLNDYWVSESEEITGVSVVWDTDDKLNSVVGFYKNRLTADDFNGNLVLDDGNSLTMSFGKSDYDGFVGVTTDGSSTVVSLTVGVRNSK